MSMRSIADLCFSDILVGAYLYSLHRASASLYLSLSLSLSIYLSLSVSLHLSLQVLHGRVRRPLQVVEPPQRDLVPRSVNSIQY